MSKCNICRENESSWAWQPFGPNDTPDCFTLPGSHYRGFAVVKVCDGCKDKVQAGKGIQFSYKRKTYRFGRGKIMEVLFINQAANTVKVTDDLEITVKDKWIEILSHPDDQFISVGFDEIDPLIEILKIAKTRFADAPDKLLKYAELIQVFENEIKWCVANPGPAVNSQHRQGFLNALMQAKYLVNQLAGLDKKGPGYMGDIGGTPYGPSDMDADELGECTCGMGAGTIALEEHAESCPMSNKDRYQFPGRFIE